MFYKFVFNAVFSGKNQKAMAAGGLALFRHKGASQKKHFNEGPIENFKIIKRNAIIYIYIYSKN